MEKLGSHIDIIDIGRAALLPSDTLLMTQDRTFGQLAPEYTHNKCKLRTTKLKDVILLKEDLTRMTRMTCDEAEKAYIHEIHREIWIILLYIYITCI